MWGTGHCRSDRGFWLDPGGVVRALLPSLISAGKKKGLFLAFRSYSGFPRHKPFAAADRSDSTLRFGCV